MIWTVKINGWVLQGPEGDSDNEVLEIHTASDVTDVIPRENIIATGEGPCPQPLCQVGEDTYDVAMLERRDWQEAIWDPPPAARERSQGIYQEVHG